MIIIIDILYECFYYCINSGNKIKLVIITLYTTELILFSILLKK